MKQRFARSNNDLHENNSLSTMQPMQQQQQAAAAAPNAGHKSTTSH
jgi:hypothetical protein